MQTDYLIDILIFFLSASTGRRSLIYRCTTAKSIPWIIIFKNDYVIHTTTSHILIFHLLNIFPAKMSTYNDNVMYLCKIHFNCFKFITGNLNYFPKCLCGHLNAYCYIIFLFLLFAQYMKLLYDSEIMGKHNTF